MITASDALRRLEEDSGLNISQAPPPRVPDGFGTRNEQPAIDDRLEGTDVGMAELMALQHGADIRWVQAWGCFLVWDDRRWQRDDTGEVMRRARATVNSVLTEAAATSDVARAKRLAQAGARYLRRDRLVAMVELFKSEPGVACRPGDFDRDAWAMNVENGTLDLHTCKLRPHDRRDMLTHLSPVEYDDLATAPRFERFLAEVFAGNTEVVAFVQRLLGSALVGVIQDPVFAVMYGAGSNGKTTLLELLRDVLGDYAKTVPPATFQTRSGDAIPNDLASLPGVRMVMCSETSEGRRLDMSVVKRTTGGDTIAARFMRGEWFEYRPQFTPFMATNHKPVIDDHGDATWNRIRLIEFPVQFGAIGHPPKDPALLGALRAERPGVLRWLVTGCLARQVAGGLLAPDDVVAATQAYRDESDVIADFIADECVEDPEAFVPSKDIAAAYGEYAKRMNGRKLTQHQLADRLRRRGFVNGTSRIAGATQRGWHGIGLLAGGIPS